MKFLLQKAISLIDIGTSFIYYLLGRELDSHDIKIINYLFSIDQQHKEIDLNYAIDIINTLNKGKDLLLVTNQDNLNILQLCILKQRLNIIRALLDYGCDPNRGSTIVNHSHDHFYPIQAFQQPQRRRTRKQRPRKVINKSSSFIAYPQQLARLQQRDTDNTTGDQSCSSLHHQQQSQQKHLHHRISDTTNQSSLLTVNINTIPSIPQSMSSLNKQQQQQQQQHQPLMHKDAHHGLNIYDLVVQDYDDEDENEDEDDGYIDEFIEVDDEVDSDENFNDDDLFSEASNENEELIVYDSPLLLACCIYNCHNLEYLISSKEELKKKQHLQNTGNAVEEEYSSYYNYYYTNAAAYLNETVLTSSSSSSNSTATTTTSKINDAEITTTNINYLEIDDDDLYYQKYDLDYTLVQDDDCCNASNNTKFRMNQEQKSNINEKYRVINDLRLKLVDVLLDYGANKHQYSKLSETSLKYLNKKSRKLIENCFKQSSAILEMDEVHFKTKQLSPLLVTLCFDDLELFRRLYENHKLLFNYIKPNEYKNLILFAIKSQAQNCLIYLLKNNKNLSQADHDILFYIISNINSTKIIDLLINIGFDLKTVNCVNNQNTILHCLFESDANNKQILSKILQKLFDNVNLNGYLSQYNQQNELCLQSLFECTSLVEKIFFLNHQQEHDLKLLFKLQTEFKETVKVLLKYGANFFLKTGQYNSSIECLLTQLQILVKKQACLNKSTTNLFCMNYLYDLFKEIFKASDNYDGGNRQGECNLLAKFFELLILNELYINEFESVLKIVRLICKFESSAGLSITSSLIKKFLNLWISQPNYLNSRQYEKTFFVKNLFRILITYGYNCNDTSLKYIDGCIQSNNLLHNLISILFNCQTGYQLDCLYDLVIYLVQYGANPNIEPYELEPKIVHCQSSIYLQKRPNDLLSQICSPFNSGFNLIKRFNSTTLPQLANGHHSPGSSSTSDSTAHSTATNSQIISQKIENWVFYNDYSSVNQSPPASSQLLINHYKKFLNFFYEYMDTEIIYECLKYRDSSIPPSQSTNTVVTAIPSTATTLASSNNSALYTQLTINSSDVLNLYLENLCSKPRTLQSLTRRYIMKIIKKPLGESVPKLPLPIRLQDYLLFNEIK